MDNIFRTIINLNKEDYSITHKDKILSIGSCFSENIGKKLAYFQFDVDVNSHGIVFNPISICNSLKDAINNKVYKEKDLSQNRDLWFSYNHHGSFSSVNKSDVLKLINERVKKANEYIKQSNHLIITLGTAYAYRHKESNKIVANCHKIPNNNFDKELLSVEIIVNEFKAVFLEILKANKNLKITLTLSPVRHLKDGLLENQRSKAILLTAIYDLKKLFNNISYFPSYEIMIDDLRDYRFFKKDMIHPNDLAIDYVWDIFSNNMFSEKTKGLNKTIGSIRQDLNHNPKNPSSKEHKKFIRSLNNKIEKFNLNNLINNPIKRMNKN